MSFVTPDHGIVAEIMNSNRNDTEITLEFHDKMLHLQLPGSSITTAMWKKPAIRQERSDAANNKPGSLNTPVAIHQ